MTIFKKIGVGLAALGATAVWACALFIRPWHLHWGATPDESSRRRFVIDFSNKLSSELLFCLMTKQHTGNCEDC